LSTAFTIHDLDAPSGTHFRYTSRYEAELRRLVARSHPEPRYTWRVDFNDVIRRESELFYSTAQNADPELGVPCCPDWNTADLVWHLGEVHWFWATDVEMRATDATEVGRGKPSRPGDYGELVAWGRSQADRMVKLLEATPDDVKVWTWALKDADHTVGFIRRHQVQEAAVHRWDLQSAATTGVPDPIDAEVASDSIDELLTITLPWGVRSDKRLPGSVHIHCTDTSGTWLIHPDGRVGQIHTGGDVAIRGAASDILLALYEREPLDILDLTGDESLAHELLQRLNTE
jgi:uncharacterized protein (TIGR03083 family)